MGDPPGLMSPIYPHVTGVTGLHVNNKGTDQPVHMHSQISAFVNLSLDCTIAKHTTNMQSFSNLAILCR